MSSSELRVGITKSASLPISAEEPSKVGFALYFRVDRVEPEPELGRQEFSLGINDCDGDPEPGD
jgi:hypothetical protein